MNFSTRLHWQAWQESNPHSSVLETAALPIKLQAYNKLLRFPMECMFFTYWTILFIFHSLRMKSFILRSRIITRFTFCAGKLYYYSFSHKLPYSIISPTTPAPTVLPPSRIANLNPCSRAIGVISSTSKLTLSPGITISTPLGRVIVPVTSVVLK